jgi:Holliday junction resolvasome RuvABC DNA-binding subunit
MDMSQRRAQAEAYHAFASNPYVKVVKALTSLGYSQQDAERMLEAKGMKRPRSFWAVSAEAYGGTPTPKYL